MDLNIKFQMIDTINQLIELLETKGVKTKTYDNWNDKSVKNKVLRDLIKDYKLLKDFASEEDWKTFIFYTMKQNITHEIVKKHFDKNDTDSFKYFCVLNKQFFELCVKITKSLETQN